MPDDTAQLSLANSIGANILARAKREASIPATRAGGSVPNYLISGLASLGCSPQEISTLTKIPQDKLPKDLIAQGKAKLIHALRRAQIKAALKGNPAMLIWLGKALLNQRDQPDSQTPPNTPTSSSPQTSSKTSNTPTTTLSKTSVTPAIISIQPALISLHLTIPLPLPNLISASKARSLTISTRIPTLISCLHLRP